MIRILHPAVLLAVSLTSTPALAANTPPAAKPSTQPSQASTALPDYAEASIGEGLTLPPQAPQGYTLPVSPHAPVQLPPTDAAAGPDRPTPQLAPSPADDQSLFGRSTLLGSFGGARTKLEESGFILAGSFTTDISQNLLGGTSTHHTPIVYLTDVNLTLLPPLLPFEGSTVFISFQNVAGSSPSKDVGDFSGLSSIDSESRTQLSELWYQQAFLDSRLSFTLGKIDAGSIFGVVDPDGSFLNSSIGFQDSQPLPTYPDPSVGLVLSAVPYSTDAGTLTLDAGIFDGSYNAGKRTGTLGPDPLFDEPSDLYLTAQLTARTADDRLSVSFGSWHHTGDFATSSGGNTEGTFGLFTHATFQLMPSVVSPAAGDSTTQPTDEDILHRLFLFAHYAYSDPRGSEAPHHFGAGALLKEPISGRSDDVLGIGFTTYSFRSGSEFPDNPETTLELFYKLQLTPYLSIQPDLQFFASPGGTNQDALVASIRISIDF